MKNKLYEFVKTHWFNLGILITLFLIAISIFYYFVIFIPKKENARVEAEKQAQLANDEKIKIATEKANNQKEQNKILLNTCINDAYDNYHNNWAGYCKRNLEITSTGLENCLKGGSINDYCHTLWDADLANYRKGGYSCSLSSKISDGLDATLKEDKNSCYKNYPIN